MQFSFTHQQEQTFCRYAELGRNVALNAEVNDNDRRFDFQSWDRLCDAGIWRIPIAEKHGGHGGTWTDCVVAMEGVASTAQDAGFLVTMLAHVGALRAIAAEGTPEQQDRWLEPLMRGEIGVTAMTESTGGSDLARMKLSAVPDADGWRISGRKVHITNAPIASFGMIAGRIPSLGAKRDITLFFIDLPREGLTIGDLEDNLGMRASPTAALIFDHVPVKPINIIGKPGDGLRVLYNIISFERALYGVIASGLLEGMVKISLERCRQRTAFQCPLGDYQYVQRRITDMKVWALITRLLAYSAIEKIQLAAEDASIVCSATKFLSGEHLLTAAEHMVELHGHLGFMNNNLSRQLRDAVGMRIAGGTSDIQRINIFNQLMRHNLHNAAALQTAAE